MSTQLSTDGLPPSHKEMLLEYEKLVKNSDASREDIRASWELLEEMNLTSYAETPAAAFNAVHGIKAPTPGQRFYREKLVNRTAFAVCMYDQAFQIVAVVGLAARFKFNDSEDRLVVIQPEALHQAALGSSEVVAEVISLRNRTTRLLCVSPLDAYKAGGREKRLSPHDVVVSATLGEFAEEVMEVDKTTGMRKLFVVADASTAIKAGVRVVAVDLTSSADRKAAPVAVKDCFQYTDLLRQTAALPVAYWGVVRLRPDAGSGAYIMEERQLSAESWQMLEPKTREDGSVFTPASSIGNKRLRLAPDAVGIALALPTAMPTLAALAGVIGGVPAANIPAEFRDGKLFRNPAEVNLLVDRELTLRESLRGDRSAKLKIHLWNMTQTAPVPSQGVPLRPEHIAALDAAVSTT